MANEFRSDIKTLREEEHADDLASLLETLDPTKQG